MKIVSIYRIIDYQGNKVFSIRWKNEKQQLHNENGPAYERADGYKQYRINGLLHRVNGPALISPEFGYEEYWKNGKYLKREYIK